jgi:sulfur carrier protein ThiS
VLHAPHVTQGIERDKSALVVERDALQLRLHHVEASQQQATEQNEQQLLEARHCADNLQHLIEQKQRRVVELEGEVVTKKEAEAKQVRKISV